MKKRRSVLWAVAVAIVVVLAVGGAAFRSAYAQGGSPGDPPSKGDVVMMRCSATGSELPVTAYQGSTAAPAKRSGSCSENLAWLLKEGFAVRDVGHYDRQGIVLYTLFR